MHFERKPANYMLCFISKYKCLNHKIDFKINMPYDIYSTLCISKSCLKPKISKQDKMKVFEGV